VYGAGEWLVEMHGERGRRTWRKLHLAVNLASGEILASELTTTEEGDAALVGPLLERITGHRPGPSRSDSVQPEDRGPGRLFGAQPDDPARHGGDSRCPTAISRFVHQSPSVQFPMHVPMHA
jgi:hypothetical protein